MCSLINLNSCLKISSRKGSNPNERSRIESGDYDPLSTDENCLSDDEGSGLQKNNELTIIKISKNESEEEPQSPILWV